MINGQDDHDVNLNLFKRILYRKTYVVEMISWWCFPGRYFVGPQGPFCLPAFSLIQRLTTNFFIHFNLVNNHFWTICCWLDPFYLFYSSFKVSALYFFRFKFVCGFVFLTARRVLLRKGWNKISIKHWRE